MALPQLSEEFSFASFAPQACQLAGTSKNLDFDRVNESVLQRTYQNALTEALQQPKVAAATEAGTKQIEASLGLKA